MPTSRNPLVPVNLTTSTPVGPQAHTATQIQTVDRVIRPRFWRRWDAMSVPAVPYNVTLSNSAHDGYSEVGGTWDDAGDFIVFSSTGSVGLGDLLGGLSFLATGSANGAVCSSATLRLNMNSGVGSGTLRIRAERNVSVASSVWLAGNMPHDAIARLTTTSKTQAYVGTSVLDLAVGPLINEVFASAFYAGGIVNFVLDGITAGCDLSFAGVGGLNVPRLIINA